jgi:hypothetical protein
MNIFIYISDNFSKNYLPFLFYRNIIYETITKYTKYNINYIYNINDFIDSENNIFLTTIYCFSKNLDQNFYFFNKSLCKKIIINTEYYEHGNIKNLLKYINLYHNNNFYIFDYNKINIQNIKKLFINVNIYYFPLIYNEYLEDFYNKNINYKLSWNEKDIDILFYGSLNERRGKIIDNLRKKYNIVYFVDIYNHSDFSKLINRSKIVLNILFYNYNIVFDYYRNSFLLANNILLVTECDNNFDYNIEYNLKDIEDNIIISNYENIENTIDNIFNKSINEIDEILLKQYNWFTKYNLRDNILNFLQIFN